ncbi:hypothetical protein J132_10262 [Termitomyces sp. J132]|nr:hypothetical protein J132_10262 [Termitomyces sp. J132]
MSAFARFLRPLPSSSRAYSSFFSSRSGGGGRYFTSAKVPKVVVASKAAAPKAEPSTETTSDAAQASATNGNANAADKPSVASSQTSSASSAAASEAPTTEGTHTSNTTSEAFRNLLSLRQQPHPAVNPKDFKLHQFFSLHRPLLLLSRPHSIFESANASSFLPDEVNAETYTTTPQWLFDDFPEATADADAAAARQLTRAITMSHAGAAVSWEQTLRRLGLDVDKDRIEMQEKLDKEWREVLMDSTKRKRRKKMKKHKLVLLETIYLCKMTKSTFFQG